MPTFIVLQCWVGLLSTFRPGFFVFFGVSPWAKRRVPCKFNGRLGRRTTGKRQFWMNSCGWRVLLYSLPDEWILSVFSMEPFLICVCVISSLFLLVKLIPSSDLEVGLFPSIVSYIDVKFVESSVRHHVPLFRNFWGHVWLSWHESTSETSKISMNFTDMIHKKFLSSFCLSPPLSSWRLACWWLTIWWMAL